MNTETVGTKPVSGVVMRWLRVGWIVLLVNALWTLAWTLYFTWDLTYHPSDRMSQAINAAGISPDFYFWVNFLTIAVLSGCFITVAVLLFIRMPDDRMALFAAVFLLGFGSSGFYPLADEFLQVWRAELWFYAIPFLINNLLAWPLIVYFFALYPDGEFYPDWIRYPALYGFLFSIAWAIFPQAFGAPRGWLSIFITLSVILVFGSSFYAQWSRYRSHSTPIQKQQTKWMVFGVAIVMVVTVLKQVSISFLFPAQVASPGGAARSELIEMVLQLAFLSIPAAIGIAIFRYRLWEIDQLINRALVYLTLTGALGLVYFGGIVLLQNVFRGFFQQQSQLAIVLSTLAIAALFNPLRRRIQDFIDRRFYRRKYDAERAIDRFSTIARDQVEIERLSGAMIQVIEENLQPKNISLWIRSTGDERK